MDRTLLIYASRDQFLDTERRLLWLAYCLHILLITLPLGVLLNVHRVLAYKKLMEQSHIDDDTMDAYITHHYWLLRTAAGVVLLGMASLGTFYYGVGIVLAFLMTLWWIYRMIRGVVSLAESEAVPVW
jgi:uncharacterized membrane protein